MFSNTFPDKAFDRRTCCEELLEIKAVHFNASRAYKFASGLMSPVYIDCRKLISYPRVRSAVMDFAAATILSEAGFEQFDCVAGGETAGIPFAACSRREARAADDLCAQAAQGPRPQCPDRGRTPGGSRVLVIEDLTTAGGSMFTFIDAIRAAGCTVDHGIALFYYGIFE
jgi:orotate phosphoribosyltransferase